MLTCLEKVLDGSSQGIDKNNSEQLEVYDWNWYLRLATDW